MRVVNKPFESLTSDTLFPMQGEATTSIDVAVSSSLDTATLSIPMDFDLPIRISTIDTTTDGLSIQLVDASDKSFGEVTPSSNGIWPVMNGATLRGFISIVKYDRIRNAALRESPATVSPDLFFCSDVCHPIVMDSLTSFTLPSGVEVQSLSVKEGSENVVIGSDRTISLYASNPLEDGIVPIRYINAVEMNEFVWMACKPESDIRVETDDKITMKATLDYEA